MSENPYLDTLRRTASTTGAQQPAVPAGPAANPYLETLQAQRTAENAALNGQLSQAVRVNPDQFARQRSVAQMMGYPTAAVEALPELEQQAKVDRIRGDIAGSPALQRAYTDADFARLAQDDSGVLSQIGQFVRNMGGSAKAGLYTASRGAAGTFQAGLDLLAPALDIFENPSASVSPNRVPVPFVAALPGGNPLRRLSETFAVLGGGADAVAKAARPKVEGIVPSGFFSGVESLIQNLLALPMAFAPGGQAAALTMMTAGTGGNAYQDASEKGLPMSQALPFAMSQAVIEYATEMFPLGALLKDVKAGAGFLRILGRQIALEIPGEQVATVLQDLNEWAVLNPEKPFSSYLEARPSAAAQTLVATIVGAGGNVAIVKGIEAVMSRAIRDGTDMQQATQTSQALGAALKGAQASALLKRDPAQFREVMNALAEDGVVYVDAQVLNQMPPDVLAQMEGVQAELPDALETNSPVAVKVADILTLAPGTPLAETFTQNARRTPDSPTLVETEEAGKVAGEFLKNEFDRVLAQAADTAAWQQSTQTVQQTILGELNTAGRFTPDVNEAYATLQANFFSTMAARNGMTPEALYAKWRLGVAARQPGGGGQVLNADSINPAEQRALRAINSLASSARAMGIDLPRIRSAPVKETLAALDKELGMNEQVRALPDGQKATLRRLFAEAEAAAIAMSRTGPAQPSQPMNDEVDPLDEEANRLLDLRDEVAAELQALGYRPTEPGMESDFETVDRQPAGLGQMPEAAQALAREYQRLGAQIDAVLEQYSQPGQKLNQPAFDGPEVGNTPIGDLTEIEVDGVMRPAVNSEGRPIHPTQEGVRNFWRGFGDSRVVDEQGRPVVSTHYTSAEFTAFDDDAQRKAQYEGTGYTTRYGFDFVFPRKGFFFFAGERPAPVGNLRAVEAYLAIKNPLDLTKPISPEDTSKIIDLVQQEQNRKPEPGHAGHQVTGKLLGGFREARKNGVTPEQLFAFVNIENFGSRGERWNRILTALGKDGLIFEGNSSGTAMLEPRRGQGDGKTYRIAVALQPGQIKSATGNRGTFDSGDANVFNQRGVQPKGREVPASIDGVSNVEAAFVFAGTQSFKTNRDFKIALQDVVNAAAKAARVDLSEFSEATERYLTRLALADAQTALRTNANAVGWYNEKVNKALRLVSLIHPEIATDPQAKFAFVWAMAVTSNGLKVDKNFELAETAYRAFKETGRMPTNIGIGTAKKAINKTLKLYNTLIDKHGFEVVERFMTTMQTAGEVTRFTGEKVNGENKTTMVYGAAALGPKIGNGFFMNLYGRFGQLTMDRWLMRTWGRWTGTLVEFKPEQVRAKRAGLKALIKELSPADKKAFEAIIKRKLAVGDLDAVGAAIWKASQKPENRELMNAIGLVDDAGKARLTDILGPEKKGTERVGLGSELRKIGNALTKYIDGQKEAPSGPPERANIRKVFSQVLAELQQEYPALTMSDLQALLWYPEKRLYDAAKTADEADDGYEDDEAPDYANAAAKLARAQGVSDADISGAIAAVDAEIQAAVSAGGARPGERGEQLLEQSPRRRPSINTLLRRSGQQVTDSVDAARRWNDGERIFGYAEQDGRPSEITSAEMLENFTADQLLALPKEVFEQEQRGGIKLGSSQGFKTGQAVKAEVYHGSDRPIADFDPAKLGDNTGAASAAEGFFFAGKESTSQRYMRANLESVTITPDRVADMPREELAGMIAEWDRQSMSDGFAYDYINDVLVDSVPGTASIVNTEDADGNVERGSLDQWVQSASQEAVEALVVAINAFSPNYPLTNDPSVEDGGSESMGSVGRYIVDLQNPFVYDFKGDRYRDVSYAEIIRQAKADGHDGVILMNTFDPGPEVDNVFVVFDAGQIQFDELAFGDDGFSQEQQPAQPGPRGTFNPATMLITLGETADLSTFLHESGHFFLEVLADLASRPNAPAGIAADMKSTLKWFGVKDLATWNAMTLDQKRPYHEKWAESFEQYLFEGKAPTPELQPLFRRFRSWMLNVYKSLSRFMTGRNLQVNDEVRQVFDRMLATDEQIAQAEQAAGMLPNFEATNEAIEALQARSLRDLKWTVRARGRALKALEKQAADLRKGVEAEVRAEVGQEPVYRAIRWLRTGEMTDEEGSLVKAEKGFRLNTDAIAEMYPESMLARPDLTGLKGMTSKTGLSPDLVADMFGYPSGDALVRAVLAAEPMGSVIEGITDQRMLERHGELATPEALEAAANEAVHNEARARSLATELKSQSEMMNERSDTGRTNAAGRPITVNTIVEAAKQFALNLVARRRVNDLKSAAWQHRAAEARAGKAWQDATSKGETTKAVQAKRDQLLNNYAAKALQEAEAEVRKIGEFFKRVTTGNNEKVVKGGRDPDVVNAMRAILAAYGVAPRLQKSALEYMEAVSRNDPAMYAALKPSVDGAMMAARPLGEMTMEELRGLNDELRAMWELAKRSRQMEVDGNLMDIEDAAADLVDRMGTIGIPAEIPGEKGAITDKQERGIKLRFALSILTRVEQWAERLDGKYGGPFLRLVFQPIKDAADRFRTDRVDYRKRYEALLKDVAPYLPRGAIAAPELGYTFGNARDSGAAELLHAILHTGNDSNKRKLLLGRGWATENADGTMDTTAWDTFLQRMAAEGKLVKPHYDFAQGVWDMLEQMKPLAQETHRQVYGRYFAEVTANEVVTPFGTYRGGYVPAQTDARLVKDAKLRELAEGENESMAYAFPASPSGFTKGRVEYNKPLMLDLRTLAQHMDKVLLFSHMQGAVTDVRRLLTNKSVSYALDRIDPGAYEGMLIPWLNRAARQVVETPVMGDRKISRLLSAGRSRAGMALMFANLSNTFQQITGFSMAAVKVKPGLMMKATAQFIADPKAMKTAVAEASPFMKDRMLNEISAMNAVVEEILLDPTMLERGQAWTQRHAYFMQAAVDNTMSPIIWTAAYNQAIAKGETERDAIRFADGTIRQTQGSTLPEDISRFESGPAYGRLFTQFIGYFNMLANTNATAISQIVGEMGLRKGAGKVLYVALAGLLVPIWVAEAIAHAFRGGPEDEDDDGYLDDWLMAVFGLGTIRGLVAQVPIAGQAAQLVVNRFNDNPADDKFSLSPAVSLIESTVSAPSSVYKAIVEDGNKQKAVRDVAAAATMITGLPIFALGRPLGYIAGMADDRIEPTGPADMVRGLVTGTASPESKVP